MSLGAAGLLILQGAAPAVQVTVSPAKVYIEKASSGQYLNFDFLLEGQSDDTVRLTSIRLTATDGAGKPWQIRFVDESGSDPSIHTLPRREIAGRTTRLIYNPFYVFPVEAPLER